MKIIIEVKNPVTPKDDAVLIYSAKDRAWRCESKARLLSDARQRIASLEETQKAQGEAIKKLAAVLEDNL